MGEVPVVGDEQQPGGVLIQAARGEQPPPLQVRGQQVQHRGGVLVLCGGEHPRGLVHHNVEVLPVGHLPPVHSHPVQGGVQLLGGVLRCLAVDGHRPAAHQPGSLLPAADIL